MKQNTDTSGQKRMYSHCTINSRYDFSFFRRIQLSLIGFMEHLLIHVVELVRGKGMWKKPQKQTSAP